jgi:hypothetical protein
VLQNVFIRTSEPLGIVLVGLAAAGALVDSSLALDSGFALMDFEIVLSIPMLPDPCAASFDIRFSRDRFIGQAVVNSVTRTPDLAAIVTWPIPSAATVRMTLLNRNPRVAETSPVSGIVPRQPTWVPGSTSFPGPFSRPQGVDPGAARDDLLEQFGRVTASGAEFFRLLDVSSNADQFGVALGSGLGGRALQQVSPPRLFGLDLVAPANTIRVLTLPAFQWEPVRNIPNPDSGFFPDLLVSDTDGGPTRIGINSVALMPVAPLPATARVLSYYNDEANPNAAVALTTALPFGMLALATLNKSQIFQLASPRVTGNHPDFPAAQLTGGLQLSFVAGGPRIQVRNSVSHWFNGVTVQTRNGYDPSNPSNIGSVLGAQETTFNSEFYTGNAQKVPLARIDISGYGASLFNDWRDPNAEIAATSEVRFEATVGRTAYEVVQVKSIAYPWAFTWCGLSPCSGPAAVGCSGGIADGSRPRMAPTTSLTRREDSRSIRESQCILGH